MQHNSIPTPNELAGGTASVGAKIAETAAELKEMAAGLVEETRRSAARGLRSAATAVQDRASQLPGADAVSEVAHDAAYRLNAAGKYLRNSGETKILADLKSVVKNNPGPCLLAAIAVGFCVGRAWRNEE